MGPPRFKLEQVKIKSVEVYQFKKKSQHQPNTFPKYTPIGTLKKRPSARLEYDYLGR